MLFDKFKKKDKKENLTTDSMWLYSEEELDELEAHIVKNFGNFKDVFHELVSPDIHLDVIVVEPTQDEPYYKLITEGAGAYKQNCPKEYEEQNGHFAEYMILLPKDWNIKSSESKNYWPIGELKKIARLPISCDTWLGTCHTIHSNEEMKPIDESTGFNSFILLNAVNKEGKKIDFTMKSGNHMNFYLLMPLYQEELEYEMNNGFGKFLDIIPDDDLLPVINPNRKRYV